MSDKIDDLKCLVNKAVKEAREDIDGFCDNRKFLLFPIKNVKHKWGFWIDSYQDKITRNGFITLYQIQERRCKCCGVSQYRKQRVN